MMNQLKVEGFKLRRFWIVYIAVAAVALMGFLFGYLKFSDTYNTHITFSEVIGDTSFMFIISLISAWFIGNDFNNRTIHNEIKIGCGRLSVILSRTLMVFISSAIIHLSYVLAVVAGFSVKYGFDTSILSPGNLAWVGVVILQLMALQSITVLLTFLLKKLAAAIAASVCVVVVMCNVLRNFIDAEIFNLSCFGFAQSGDAHTLTLSAIFALATIVIFLGISYILFRKSAIK